MRLKMQHCGAAIFNKDNINKKIGSGSTLKVAAPAPQHWLKVKLEPKPEPELGQSDGSGSNQIPRLRHPAGA